MQDRVQSDQPQDILAVMSNPLQLSFNVIHGNVLFQAVVKLLFSVELLLISFSVRIMLICQYSASDINFLYCVLSSKNSCVLWRTPHNERKITKLTFCCRQLNPAGTWCWYTVSTYMMLKRCVNVICLQVSYPEALKIYSNCLKSTSSHESHY